MRKIQKTISWMLISALLCTSFGSLSASGMTVSAKQEDTNIEDSNTEDISEEKEDADTGDIPEEKEDADTGDIPEEKEDADTGDAKPSDENTGIIKTTGVKAKWSESNKYVTVSWNKLAIANGYYVYRKAGNGAYAKLTSTTKTSCKDKIKALNTVYTYKVIAYLGSGDDMVLTPASKEVSVKVPAMTVPTLKISKSGRKLRISISKFGLCSVAYVYIKVGSRKWKKLNTLKKREYLDFQILRRSLTYQFCVKGKGKVNGKTYYSAFSKAKKYKY